MPPRPPPRAPPEVGARVTSLCVRHASLIHTTHVPRVRTPRAAARYAVYDHEFSTHDGRLASKLFFISWLPRNATPQAKMGYTTGKVIRERKEGQKEAR